MGERQHARMLPPPSPRAVPSRRLAPTKMLSPLIYARAQMGLSLAFHIVFAAVGVALPLLMVLADALWIRTRDPDYLELSKRLAKGTGILFAVGAVSGTVLSFELGLLWPTFMG